ncbi:hypothetical protein CEE35_09070 [Candidatus Aerophobetes bacterium Ae_b3b]|nr:MAG: hypothetical protein CEE35_09070 [Candidatus Aerophobetes bacterium Ae_b3b]
MLRSHLNEIIVSLGFGNCEKRTRTVAEGKASPFGYKVGLVSYSEVYLFSKLHQEKESPHHTLSKQIDKH